MLTRANILINWEMRSWTFSIPIPLRITEHLPINEELNFSSAASAVEKAVTYENLEEAIKYELGMRKDACNAVFGAYKEGDDYETSIDKIFSRFNANPSSHPGSCRLIDHYFSLYSKALERLAPKRKNTLDALLYKDNAKRYSMQLKRRAQHEVLKPVEYMEELYFKTREDCGNIIEHTVKRYRETPLFPKKYIFKPEGGKVNLLRFAPDVVDFRNFLVVDEIEEGDSIVYGNFDNLKMEEFSPSLFYVINCFRPFEQLDTALLGRDMVIYYLNNLLEKL